VEAGTCLDGSEDDSQAARSVAARTAKAAADDLLQADTPKENETLVAAPAVPLDGNADARATDDAGSGPSKNAVEGEDSAVDAEAAGDAAAMHAGPVVEEAKAKETKAVRGATAASGSSSSSAKERKKKKR